MFRRLMTHDSLVKQLEYDHNVKQKAMLLVGWNYSGGQGEDAIPLHCPAC